MAIIDKRIPESRPTVSQKPLAHFFSFISNTGIAAILLGGAGMITSPEYFWFEVVLVNFGLILLAIQAYREQWQEALVRWLLVCTTLAATIGFNWFWVFVDLPLEVSSIIIDAERLPGSSVAGIPWRSEFTELQVFIKNPSTRNYYDMDVIVRPDLPVAKIAQMTDIQGVSLQDRYGATKTMVHVEGAQKTIVPLVLLATDSGYRVRCEKLSANTALQFVLAIVEMKVADKPPGESFTKRSFLIDVYPDGTRYWYGLENAEPYRDRKIPKKINLDGEFTAGQRKRTLTTEIAPLNPDPGHRTN